MSPNLAENTIEALPLLLLSLTQHRFLRKITSRPPDHPSRSRLLDHLRSRLSINAFHYQQRLPDRTKGAEVGWKALGNGMRTLFLACLPVNRDLWIIRMFPPYRISRASSSVYHFACLPVIRILLALLKSIPPYRDLETVVCVCTSIRAFDTIEDLNGHIPVIRRPAVDLEFRFLLGLDVSSPLRSVLLLPWFTLTTDNSNDDNCAEYPSDGSLCASDSDDPLAF